MSTRRIHQPGQIPKQADTFLFFVVEPEASLTVDKATHASENWDWEHRVNAALTIDSCLVTTPHHRCLASSCRRIVHRCPFLLSFASYDPPAFTRLCTYPVRSWARPLRHRKLLQHRGLVSPQGRIVQMEDVPVSLAYEVLWPRRLVWS